MNGTVFGEAPTCGKNWTFWGLIVEWKDLDGIAHLKEIDIPM
jgi:hypothetical protein